MNRFGWILAGSTLGVAGACALSIALAPTSPAPVAATPAPEVVTAPVVAVAPAVPVVTPAPAKKAAQAPSVDVAGVVPGSAGMVIAIDPETGELGLPTEAQRAELKLDADQMVERGGGVLTNNPDGSVTLDLQGTNQDYVQIRRTADGRVFTVCNQHPGSIEHIHADPTALEEK